MTRRPSGRTLLAAALLALLLIDAIAGSLLAAQRNSRQERLDQQLTPARSKVTALLKAYVDQETGVRGFVVTGSEEFLEPYVAGRRDRARLVRDLDRLLEHDPDLAAGVEEVVRAGEDWTRQAAEPEIAYRRAGDVTRSVDLVVSRTGKVRFDRLRAAVADLQRDLDAEAQQVSEQTRRSADLANDVVVGSALLALALAAALSAQVQRRLLRPVRLLRGQAEQAARDPRVGSVELVEGDADVRAVASSAEQLRQAAVEHEDSAARAHDALAQEGPSVAAITAELTPTVGALPAGLLWAGRTMPAEGAVAGDVYDVFALPSEQVAVLVADAAGHGPHAGLVALRAKHILVGALRRGLDPAAALARLSVELDDTGEGFLTVFLATVDLPAGTLRYASAGHPSAALVHAGTAQLLPATGPLLGPVPGTWTTAAATLPPRGTLAVFTDGIVEARTSTEHTYGSDRLVELLLDATTAAAASGGVPEPEGVLETVFREVKDSIDGSRGAGDDRTLVLLHRPPRREVHESWEPLPSAPASAGVARGLLRQELSRAGDSAEDEDLADAAQLCLTELVTNAVLHGGDRGIAVSVGVRDGAVHLAVRDSSAEHPRVLVHSASAATGRGLALVAQLSNQWGSDPDPSGGKVVWCELSAASARRGATVADDPWLAELGDLLGELEEPKAATAGPSQPPEVLLLRYPVRRGMLAREHYRSLLRECQLRTMHVDQNESSVGATSAARLLAEIYTGQLAAEHGQGSDLRSTQDALLAAFTRGDRATDLTVPVGGRASELLAAMQAALVQVRVATSTGDLLTEKTPRSVVELDEWTAQQWARQLAGEPPVPWAGPLD